MSISYVLPIKWDNDQPLDELTDYLQYLSAHVDLIVVDGSAPANFEKHHRAWSHLCRHFPPQPEFHFANGKVNGVMSGLVAAAHEHVVFADDDVRYELKQLEQLDLLLRQYQLVSPQNYFLPCPWHATWDSSRSLLNLALGHDYPGTLAVQRDFLLNLGGYDGNVLFENLELIRTIKAGGGKICYRDDLLVRRLPPETKHFWSQRVRQAYDDYAQPARLVFFFALLPILILSAIYSPLLIIVFVMSAIALAELGRRRSGGSQVFSLGCSFAAPLWLLERGLCTWIAFFNKLTKGGVVYNKTVITKAANSIESIRKRFMLYAIHDHNSAKESGNQS